MAEIKPAGTPASRFLVVVVGSEDEAAEVLGCVEFGVDWGHEWPLWGPCEETYPLGPAELGLPQTLAAQLRTFYDYWEAHYLFEQGWDSLEHCRHAHAEADRLTELVAADVRGRYVVVNRFKASFPCTADAALAR